MSMGGAGRRGRVGNMNEELQRELNKQAPQIENLLGRIGALFRPYRLRLFIIIALVLISSALTVLPPLLTQRAFDYGLFPTDASGTILPPDIRTLVIVVLIMIAVVLASDALGVWQKYLTAVIGNRVMSDLRVRLFTQLQHMELNFFTHTRTGVIQSRLANDVGGVANVLNNTVSSVVGNTVTVIAALVSMILLSWQLTIVAVIITPVLILVQRRVGQVRARIATATQESLSEMTAITQEALSVSGVLLAKTFNRQQDEIQRYRDENDKQARWQVRLTMSGQWFFALVQVFLAVIPAGIYVVAAYLITNDIPLSAGTIVAFTTVQSRLMMPLMGLLRVGLDLQTSRALFARIFEYLDLKPAISDAPDAQKLVEPVRGQVRFDGVKFSYPDAEPDEPLTLRDVSFTVEPGQFAAFVGPSGAGKTTIGYLIARLHEANNGRVLIDDQPVRSVLHSSLIDNIGIVSQETYLFHASIADNLRYGKPQATQEEIEHAARLANIHDTIAGFPQGYDTIVGERGYRLSGGQKQRIAIARVLLKDPKILILDEATSALDGTSERLVQQAIEAASHERTVIAIAHRLSTIISADVIFVLDQGQVVEQGTHAELVTQTGLYAELYDQQT